jgi:hypothetical protein
MRTVDRGLRIGQGSAYVAIVITALATYFVYQTWFNPSRAVKRRLGQIAGVLSVPDHEPELDRVVRLSKLRSYLADDISLRTATVDFHTRDTIVGVLSGIRAVKGVLDVQFVDVQVAVDSDTAAHAGLMIEINTEEPQTGEWRSEQHEAIAALEKRRSEWIVVTAEIKPDRPRP